MVNVDTAVIARLKKGGRTFEVLVDCDNALKFKGGENVDMNSVLATEEIYDDVKKGMHAPDESLKVVFGTNNKVEIAKKIIKEGDVQITAEHRKRLLEQKRRLLVTLIHRNAIDPKTGLPHPPQRIENAMDEVKVRVDEHKSAEAQVKDVINKLKPVIPIKYEIREVLVVFPAKFAGKAMSIVRSLCTVLDEKWLNDGSLSMTAEVPAGMQEEFEKKLNDLTHGDLDMKVVKVK